MGVNFRATMKKEKQNYIKVDPQDIKTLLNLLQDNPKVQKYIKEYIFNPTIKKQ